MANLNGISAYQQTNQIWNQANKKTDSVEKKDVAKEEASAKTNSNVKTSEWKPLDTTSSLIPTKRDGIGMAIGDVQLSDKAKDYYSQLKSKFGNMDFIVVSKDMMAQVKANAAAYGNSSKMMVLIDDEKLERMATDEEYRKKYEGIIMMSQQKLESAKNSLISSGANVKNFGMYVNDDGTTSFFATLEKAAEEQSKRIEKQVADKRAERAKERNQADKKALEKRIENAKENRKEQLEKITGSDRDESDTIKEVEKEYFTIETDSLEDLIEQVSKYAFEGASKTALTENEKALGQNIDFKG